MRIEVKLILEVHESGAVRVRPMGWTLLAEAGDPPMPRTAALQTCAKSFAANVTRSQQEFDSAPGAPPDDVPAEHMPAQEERGEAARPGQGPSPTAGIVRILASLGIEEQAATMILAAHPAARVASVANWIVKKRTREAVADPQALLLACLSRPA